MQSLKVEQKKKQVAIAGALIVAGVDVNYRDVKGATPLGEAISLDQPVVSKYLVDAGADVSAPTRNKSFPLIEGSVEERLSSPGIAAYSTWRRYQSTGCTGQDCSGRSRCQRATAIS